MPKSTEYDISWLNSLKLNGSANNFVSFCKLELVRRSQIEIDFDTTRYNEAVKLVLRQLGALEMEGMK